MISMNRAIKRTIGKTICTRELFEGGVYPLVASIMNECAVARVTHDVKGQGVFINIVCEKFERY